MVMMEGESVVSLYTSSGSVVRCWSACGVMSVRR